MTPQFQVGARYLMDFPTEIPVASMRTIAEQAGVQPATLVRLAQSLGYEGWGDLKRVYVQSLRNTPMRYAQQARKLVRTSHPDALEHTIALHTENIQQLAQVNTAPLKAAARLLTAAKHVHIAGFRASFSPAFTFQYLYRLFRSSVSLLRADAGTLDMELRAIHRGDITVVIGFAPYSRESLQVAQSARKAGSKLLAICDSVVAPIALEANCVLVFPTTTQSFFPSSAPAMALVEILIEQLLAQAGPKAIEDIRRAEEKLHETGAYLDTSKT